jgi:IS4 transposase
LKKKKLDSFKFKTSYDSKPNTLFTVAIQLFVVKKQNQNKKMVDTLIWFSYASNTPVSVKYLVELYKTRWGIETHYRVERQFLAKTCSRSNNFRLLLFGVSLLFDSLWLILNALLNRKNDSNHDQNFKILYFRIYNYDKLMMTAKRFIRRLIYILRELVKFKK